MGAALLSFLYRGMRRYKTEEKKFVDGNTWVLLSFMLFHIPKLQQELQIDLTVQPPTPLLFSVVNSLEKIGRDHYSRYVPKDIKWHPYTREMLPAMVQEQISFTTRLSPLFCLNYVEHHLPHLLANQFELLEGLDIDVAQDALQPIVFKANKGKSGSNFLKHYEKELLAWTMRRILALERSTSPTQIVSESSLSPPDTHIQLGAVVQITPLTHIAFEYSPPPRDTPVQHAEERSTSPTQIVTESSLSPLDTHIQLSAEIKLVKWLWIVEKESASLGPITDIHLSSSVNVSMVGSKSKRVQNICSFQNHVSSLNLNVQSTISSTQAKKVASDRYVVGVYQRGDAMGEN